MSFDKLVEEKIRAAMAAGEFDHLAGAGEPLDLTAYFATPEEWRVGYSLLKSAGFIPEEAQLYSGDLASGEARRRAPLAHLSPSAKLHFAIVFKLYFMFQYFRTLFDGQ